MSDVDNKNSDLDFLNKNIPIVQEDIRDWQVKNPDQKKAVLESSLVNNNEYKAKNHKEHKRKQKLDHENQNQELRKKNLRNLFLLTLVWVVMVWTIVLLQGFGGFPLQLQSNYIYLNFKLTDTVLIAFMTTTTATVLGLYGIGAYWLFKSKKNINKP